MKGQQWRVGRGCLAALWTSCSPFLTRHLSFPPRSAEEQEPLRGTEGRLGAAGTDRRPPAWGRRRQGLKLDACENGQGGGMSWRQQLERLPVIN